MMRHFDEIFLMKIKIVVVVLNCVDVKKKLLIMMVMNLLFVLFDLEEKDFETLSCDLSLQNYIKI